MTYAPIVLSPEQESIVADIEAFMRASDAPTYFFTGPAGTGKTEILKELFLRHPNCHMSAPTGKACSVLTAKVLAAEMARTVQQLRETGHEAIAYELVCGAYLDYRDEDKEQLLIAASKALGRAIRIYDKAKTPHSLLYEPIELLDHRNKAELSWLQGQQEQKTPFILLDEASMVTRRIVDDFLARGYRIIASGDQHQLPPVNRTRSDENTAYFVTPDSRLETIHRQALESPIIRQSINVREGRGYQSDGRDFQVVPALTHDIISRADVILVHKNKTRHTYNNYMRKQMGIAAGAMPRRGEPIVCLRNNYAVGAMNGEMFHVAEDYERPAREAMADGFCVPATDTFKIPPLKVHRPGDPSGKIIELFLPHIEGIDQGEPYRAPLRRFKVCPLSGERVRVGEDGFPLEDDWIVDGYGNPLRRKTAEEKEHGDFPVRVSQTTQPADRNDDMPVAFGYAMTVHKAQGSEFGSVLILNEFKAWEGSYAERELARRRWLYTAITRARNNVKIYKM